LGGYSRPRREDHIPEGSEKVARNPVTRATRTTAMPQSATASLTALPQVADHRDGQQFSVAAARRWPWPRWDDDGPGVDQVVDQT
jgi:hypothetical protein